MKKWIAVLSMLCCMVFLMPLAKADFAPLYEAYMAQIDEGAGISLTMTPTLKAFLPFLADRIEPMNRILKKTAIQLYLDDKQTDFALMIGEKTIAALSLTDNGKEMALAGDALGDTVLVGSNGKNPLAVLFGMEEYDALGQAMLNEKDAFELASSLRRAAAALARPETEGKKAKETKNFKDIGKATQKVVYTLPLDEANQLQMAAMSDVAAPFLYEWVQGLVLTGENAKMSLYKDKQDQDIAQIWTFNALLSGSERKCTLTWAYVETDSDRKDSIQFLHTDLSGKDKKTVTANIETSITDNENRLSIQMENAFTQDKEKAQTGYQVELTCATRDNTERLYGTITYTEILGEDTDSFQLNPDIVTIAYDSEMALSGKLGAAVLHNGTTIFDGDVAFELKPGEPLHIQKGTARVDMATADLSALQKAVNQRVVKNTVISVLSLPNQDLTLLTQLITEEDLTQIIQGMTTPISTPVN